MPEVNMVLRAKAATVREANRCLMKFLSLSYECPASGKNWKEKHESAGKVALLQ
jgi:hypothetical protein